MSAATRRRRARSGTTAARPVCADARHAWPRLDATARVSEGSALDQAPRGTSGTYPDTGSSSCGLPSCLMWRSPRGAGPARAGVEGVPGPLEPAPVDDLVLVSQRRRIEVGVEAVDLPLEPVRIEVADREHRVPAGGCRRSTRRRRGAGTDLGQRRDVGNRPAEVVEPAPPEHRRPGPRWRRVVADHLEHMEHGVAGEDRGLAPMARSSGPHQGRVEADRRLVEGGAALDLDRPRQRGGRLGQVAAVPAGAQRHLEVRPQRGPVGRWRRSRGAGCAPR